MGKLKRIMCLSLILSLVPQDHCVGGRFPPTQLRGQGNEPGREASTNCSASSPHPPFTAVTLPTPHLPFHAVQRESFADLAHPSLSIQAVGTEYVYKNACTDSMFQLKATK